MPIPMTPSSQSPLLVIRRPIIFQVITNDRCLYVRTYVCPTCVREDGSDPSRTFDYETLASYVRLSWTTIAIIASAIDDPESRSRCFISCHYAS